MDTSPHAPAPQSTSPSPTEASHSSLPRQRPRWAHRFHAWRQRHISDFVFMVWLAAIVGVLCGFAAYVFKLSIAWASGWFLPHISVFGKNWWLLFVPVIGILLTGIFTRYIIRTDLTHGCALLVQDLKNKMYRLRHNIVVSPIIGGTLTLGFGGSAGAEGPIAYTGAAIGSNVGQALGLPPSLLKILIGCGAGAGIAGIFMAPIGGLMFALEVIRIELTTVNVLGVTIACLASYLTISACSGFGVDLAFNGPDSFDMSLWPVVLALGIFTGLYSLYYSAVMHRLDKFYGSITNPWLRNLTGGLMLGVLLVLFPSLFGVGYPVLGHVIGGDFEALAKGCVLSGLEGREWYLALCAAGILLCKCWATSSTNSSGGVAGDFAPTLFAGGMCGFLFGFIWNHLFGTVLPVGSFAYLGMAGVMAGAIQAPLMAIFITMEMCQGYHYALPLTLSAVVSYSVVRSGAWIARLPGRLILHEGYRHLFK